MDDVMKMIKSLEESSLMIKGVSETIKNEAKEQKGGLIGMLLSTLDDSLLENPLTPKGVMKAGEGTIRSGEGVIAMGQGWVTLEQVRIFNTATYFN